MSQTMSSGKSIKGMNKLPTLSFTMRMAAAGILWILVGCQRALLPGEFVKAYRHEYGSEFLSEDYKVTVLPLTDVFLAARVAAEDSGNRAAPLAAGNLEKGIRISVQIEQRKPASGPEDLSKDLLNGALLQGTEAFVARRHFLENEVSAYGSLECGGQRFQPLAYRFSRGIGFPAVHSFLFLFDPEKDGRRIPDADCRFSLKDIGIGTGTVEAALRKPGRLTLKTRDQS